MKEEGQKGQKKTRDYGSRVKERLCCCFEGGGGRLQVSKTEKGNEINSFLEPPERITALLTP